MSKIILIAGYPAAGKSTFARKLSEHLKIPYLAKDNIREIMADAFGAKNRELLNRNKNGSRAAFALMLHMAERLLQVGSPCILESNFQVLHPHPTPEIEQIKYLLAKHNCECLTFTFKGDLDIISKRYFDRDANRHWVHEKAENPQSIKEYCTTTRLDEFAIGKTITIDTTTFSSIDHENLYALARNFLTATATCSL